MKTDHLAKILYLMSTPDILPWLQFSLTTQYMTVDN